MVEILLVILLLALAGIVWLNVAARVVTRAIKRTLKDEGATKDGQGQA